jgi:hypothetical protein
MTAAEITKLATDASTTNEVWLEAYNLVLSMSDELTPQGLTKAYARVAVLQDKAREANQRYVAEAMRGIDALTAPDVTYTVSYVAEAA